jgi:hypothetical protein
MLECLNKLVLQFLAFMSNALERIRKIGRSFNLTLSEQLAAGTEEKHENLSHFVSDILTLDLLNRKYKW